MRYFAGKHRNLHRRPMRQNTHSSNGLAPTVSFAEKLAASDAFNEIFREGMGLVEEAAAYLDMEGRSEAQVLPRSLSRAYAAESMRLTTRLMQIASWLLFQRAVNEGGMTRRQSVSNRRRVNLQQQELASTPELFQLLPMRLQELSLLSIRLQARIIHLDKLLYGKLDTEETLIQPQISPVQAQLNQIREAFTV